MTAPDPGLTAEAKRWDGTRASIEEIAQWANANGDLLDDFTLEYSFTTGTDVFDVRIATDNGDEVVSSGDWIIRDTAGEFHLCRTIDTATLNRAEKAEATIARVKKLAHDMRGWCSPHGISVTYSDRIVAALEGEQGEPRNCAGLSLPNCHGQR